MDTGIVNRRNFLKGVVLLPSFLIGEKISFDEQSLKMTPHEYKPHDNDQDYTNQLDPINDYIKQATNYLSRYVNLPTDACEVLIRSILKSQGDKDKYLYHNTLQIEDGETFYKMWYSGKAADETTYRIHHATSTDGITWSKTRNVL